MNFKFPTSDDIKDHFETEVLPENWLMLSYLNRSNLESRRLMSASIYNAIYMPLEAGEGDLGRVQGRSKNELRCALTLELLTKAFMALEDLGKILHCARRPLREFSKSFVHLNQDRSLSTIKHVAAQQDASLLALVPLWEPSRYGLTGDDALALERYNAHTVDTLRKVFTFLDHFIKLHQLAYNRYKHGMPVILGLEAEGMPTCEGIDGLMGVQRDGAKSVGFMVVGSTVAQKLVGLTSAVVKISKMLVTRRIQMAQFGGIPLPLLCVSESEGTETNYSAWSFGPHIEEPHKGRALMVFQKLLDAMTQVDIQLNLQADVGRDQLSTWTEFYMKDWTVG